MHVLIIPSWYPQNAQDITGSFFREQAIALHKYGCKVGVIYPNHWSFRNWRNVLSESLDIEMTEDEGVITYRKRMIGWVPRSLTLHRMQYLKVGFVLFQKYVEAHGKPDILHAHSILNAGLLASKIHLSNNLPFVITEHSSGFARGMFSKRELHLAESASKLAAKRISVSKELSKTIISKFNNKTNDWDALPNIVNQKFFDVPIEAKEQRKDFKLINIAFMEKNKSQDNLLYAFAKSFKEDYSVTLTIGGDGPEMSSLRSLATRLNISDQVVFTGRLTRDQVLMQLRDADAFVLSSKYETFGVVVVEALALGVPVIATRCGGPESILRKEDGLLVPVDDVLLLAAAMLEMYNNRGSYNEHEIREACKARFGEFVISKKLFEIYSEACKPLG